MWSVRAGSTGVIPDKRIAELEIQIRGAHAAG